MRVFALTLGAVILALFLGGCQTATTPAPKAKAEGEEPAPAPRVSAAAAQRFTSYIRIEGVVEGGFIKLNGSQASMFPGYVALEVDEAGKAVRQYVVALSTNILGGDLGQFVIEQGQEAPVKIYYERTGPVATGSARVEGRR